MAVGPGSVWEEIDEKVLTCEICAQLYDLQVHVPRILPCHHSLCGACTARLREQGTNACPFCRKPTTMSEAFPEDIARADLLNCKKAFQQRVLSSRSRQDVCQKHQDKKLEFLCATCKSALCCECVVEHKNKTGHDTEMLGDDILEQIKEKIEAHSKELDNIRESSLYYRAKIAATSLQEMNASFKAAEEKIEDIFEKAGNVLIDQKALAVAELRRKWKTYRMELGNEVAITKSLVSSAKTSTALSRTVSSLGLPSHIVAQEQELERAVQEARAEAEKPSPSSILYKVKKDLSGLVKYAQELGSPVPVTSRSTSIPTAATVTSSTILAPDFWLEPGRCKAGCALWGDWRTLTNKRRPQSGGTGQYDSRPLAFLGTCGSVDLAQPALHYWTVTFMAWGRRSGDRCEFGLASLQTLNTCSEGQRISDHDVNSATLVVVVDRRRVTLEGRNWTKDVDTPQPHQRHDVTYTCLWEGETHMKPYGGGHRLHVDLTLGFLYDNRQPQSPRVLVVEVKSCRLLGVRCLSPSPDLRPVLRVWPTGSDHGSRDVFLQVETGSTVLNESTAWHMQKLLGRMDR